MVWSKIMVDINKKKLFQVSLVIIGFAILFFTYFFNFEKSRSLKETKKEEIIKKEEIDEEIVNKFEDVEHQGIDNNGNRFVIKSKYAEFEKERPEILNMEEVVCVFTFKDNTILTVVSDFGVFNNITNDMKFTDNVKMDYLKNIIFSDRATFNNYENQLLVAGNIKGQGPTTNLKADELDFDLNTKNLKISMYSEERVNIKTKF